jgi:hypothetical protein
MKRLIHILNSFVVGSILMMACSTSQAVSILVGQCVQYGACYNGGPTPWSDTLSLSNLTSLGLGSNVDLIAQQTSQYVIRLGATTMTFDTTGSPITQTLSAFSGNGHADPGPYETDTVGIFSIPINALDATISGTFGNSVSSSSAGVNVYLGAVPEPETYAMLLAGLGLIGFIAYRRKNDSSDMPMAV